MNAKTFAAKATGEIVSGKVTRLMEQYGKYCWEAARENETKRTTLNGKPVLATTFTYPTFEDFLNLKDDTTQ